MASQTEENYLKSLFSLTFEKNGVSLSELGEVLQVRLPTVNSMVKKLKIKGLVVYEKYKPVSLTEKGQKEAALIIRKHRLTEMFLVEKMGFGWEEVHEIAEQVEHINSSTLFERMDEMLGFPKIDPHGSPIPDKFGKISKELHKKLCDCQVGDTVKLIALAHSSTEFLKFLDKRELNLGTELSIRSIEDFDNSMVVKYANHPSELLSKFACEHLLVDHL